MRYNLDVIYIDLDLCLQHIASTIILTIFASDLTKVWREAVK